MEEVIEGVVHRAIERVNELLPVGESVPKGMATVLLGPGGRLDSMGFVNFLVALEEEFNERFGTRLALPELMLTDNSGVRTIGDLCGVLARLYAQSVMRSDSGTRGSVREFES
jgi:acyl carrier protein